MQVDLCTGNSAVTTISAHIEQIHPTFLEFSKHEMPHFVRSQLGEMQCISNPVEQIFHRPFCNGTTWVSGRVGQKNGTIPVASIAPDERCTIPFNIFFEAKPGRMREHNDPRHMVFCDLSPDRDGMASPVNIIDTKKDNLLTAESPIMRQQDDGLIANRALCQHIPQNGFPLNAAFKGCSVPPGSREPGMSWLPSQGAGRPWESET